MKALFLDVDGVLNTTRWLRDRGAEWPPWAGVQFDLSDPDCWASMLQRELVARLNRVLDATGATIVVSSSWGAFTPASTLDAAFKLAGCTHQVTEVTPRDGNSDENRLGQIRLWLARSHRDVERWAIVDDTRFDGFIAPRRFVRTNQHVGLTDDDADNLIRLLGPRLPARVAKEAAR
jgi:hypothetical protein